MLNPRKKITRQEIKEDPLVTYYVKTRKFLELHQKVISYGLMAVLGIILITVFMQKSKSRSERQAAVSMSIPEQFIYFNDADRAIPDLEKIISTYSGTQAAGRAVYLVASTYYEKGEYEKAKTQFSDYINEYGDNALFAPSSYAGVAACYEQEGNFPEAAKFYERAAKKYPDDYAVPYHLYDAARCYLKANEMEKSRTLFQEIVDKYPESGIFDDAELMVCSL